MKNELINPSSTKPFSSNSFWLAGTSICVAMLVMWLWLTGLTDRMSFITEPEALQRSIETVGPTAVVVLLALAVVVSPIPSGPIAMAAGAVLGPLAGGGLTALGALLGAVIAFSLSRGLGYRPLASSNLPLAHWLTQPRSQGRLALLVLLSRLVPFISFDAVSYVAGLTAIRPVLFALATAIGVLPASFAFAALGAGMAQIDSLVLMIAACGVTAVLPIGLALVRAIKARGA